MIEVSRCGIYITPSKQKALLQDWKEPVPALTLYGDQIEIVNSFKYHRGLITIGGGHRFQRPSFTLLSVFCIILHKCCCLGTMLVSKPV